MLFLKAVILCFPTLTLFPEAKHSRDLHFPLQTTKF